VKFDASLFSFLYFVFFSEVPNFPAKALVKISMLWVDDAVCIFQPIL